MKPLSSFSRLAIRAALFTLGLGLVLVALRLEDTPAKLLAVVGLVLLNLGTPLVAAWGAWRQERRSKRVARAKLGPWLVELPPLPSGYRQVRDEFRWELGDDTTEVTPCQPMAEGDE